MAKTCIKMTKIKLFFERRLYLFPVFWHRLFNIIQKMTNGKFAIFRSNVNDENEEDASSDEDEESVPQQQAAGLPQQQQEQKQQQQQQEPSGIKLT